MILISHAGNRYGPDPSQENDPVYIQQALYEGFHVKIDLWVLWIRSDDEDDDEGRCPTPHLFLGSNAPQYDIDPSFLHQDRVWIQCKNKDALSFCLQHQIPNPFFYHDVDDYTLTSQGQIWTAPGVPLIPASSIANMPEIEPHPIHPFQQAIGVCSDHVGFGYKYILEKFTLKSDEGEYSSNGESVRSDSESEAGVV